MVEVAQLLPEGSLFCGSPFPLPEAGWSSDNFMFATICESELLHFPSNKFRIQMIKGGQDKTKKLNRKRTKGGNTYSVLQVVRHPTSQISHFVFTCLGTSLLYDIFKVSEFNEQENIKKNTFTSYI